MTSCLRKCSNFAQNLSWKFWLFASVAYVNFIVICITGPVISRPGFFTKDFQNTSCKVVSRRNIGSRRCSCSVRGSSRFNNNNNNCRSQFPCYRVFVQFEIETTKKGTGNQATEAQIFEDDVDLHRNRECSFLPSCSSRRSINEELVDEFLNTYGVVSSMYPCIYNPKNTTQVILSVRYTSAAAIVSLAVPGSLLCIGLTGTVITLLFHFKKRKLQTNRTEEDSPE